MFYNIASGLWMLHVIVISNIGTIIRQIELVSAISCTIPSIQLKRSSCLFCGLNDNSVRILAWWSIPTIKCNAPGHCTALYSVHTVPIHSSLVRRVWYVVENETLDPPSKFQTRLVSATPGRWRGSAKRLWQSWGSTATRTSRMTRTGSPSCSWGCRLSGPFSLTSWRSCSSLGLLATSRLTAWCPTYLRWRPQSTSLSSTVVSCELVSCDLWVVSLPYVCLCCVWLLILLEILKLNIDSCISSAQIGLT